MKDLKDLKAGDKVWTIKDGWNVVKNIDKSIVDYPILVGIELYTIDGKIDILDKNPSIFLTNPFEKQGKWMMVSNCPIDENNKGDRRFVFSEKKGRFIAWNYAKNDEELQHELGVSNWKYAKEITEPLQVELTLDQIAEKFGCDVNQLKIKK